jgi:hypothetical protein
MTVGAVFPVKNTYKTPQNPVINLPWPGCDDPRKELYRGLDTPKTTAAKGQKTHFFR